MNQSTDVESLLEHLNDDIAEVVCPAMIYIGLLILLGVAGNSMTWYFYGCKSKKTPATIFILSLSTFDLISCILSMPVEMADLRFYYVFKSEAACKIFEFVNHFASTASAFALLAIAGDRYRRICFPFERQLEIKHAKSVCGVCVTLAILVSWPPLVFYTILRYEIPSSYSIKIKAYDCGSSKETSLKSYVFAYNAILLTGFIIITILLSVLYSLIGRQLFRHKKFRFYVSKKSLKKTVSAQTISLSDFSSDQDSDAPPDEELKQSSFSSVKDPPDAAGSITDLRKYVTGRLPEVEGGTLTSGLSLPVTDTYNQSEQTRRDFHSISGGSFVRTNPNQVPSSVGNECNMAQSESSPSGSRKSDTTYSKHVKRTCSLISVATVSNQPPMTAAPSFTETARSYETDGTYESDEPNEQNKWKTERLHTPRRSKRATRSNIVTPTSGTTASNNDTSRASSTNPMTNLFVAGGQNRKQTTDTTNATKDIRMKMLDINTMKYTIIMLVITAVFVVSFLPHICLVIWRWNLDDFEVHVLNNTELVWYNIGVRSFFLNSALNPLIYGLFNSKFRAFFYSFFCTRCAKKQTKLRRTESASSC